VASGRLDALVAKQVLERSPIEDLVAAVSVGIVDGEPRLDLSYEEDSKAQVDMNVVMTGGGRYVEIQGTAESGTFSREDLDRLTALGDAGIASLVRSEVPAPRLSAVVLATQRGRSPSLRRIPAPRVSRSRADAFPEAADVERRARRQARARARTSAGDGDGGPPRRSDRERPGRRARDRPAREPRRRPQRGASGARGGAGGEAHRRVPLRGGRGASRRAGVAEGRWTGASDSRRGRRRLRTTRCSSIPIGSTSAGSARREERAQPPRTRFGRFDGCGAAGDRDGVKARAASSLGPSGRCPHRDA
jgi:hypothetical protein